MWMRRKPFLQGIGRQNLGTVYAFLWTNQLFVWYRDVFVFVLYSLPDAVRRSGISKPYRFCNAAAIYISVSDGMVFGVHVDTGIDSAFPAYTKDSLCAEQTICTGDLHYPCGYHCIYRNYLYQGAAFFGLTHLPFWYFIFLLIVALLYMLLTTVVKAFYQKKYHELIWKEESVVKKKIGFVSMDSVLAKMAAGKTDTGAAGKWMCGGFAFGYAWYAQRRGNVTAFEHLEGGGVLSPTFRWNTNRWAGNLSEEQESKDAGGGGFSYAEGVEILYFLAQNRGEVFTKEQFIKRFGLKLSFGWQQYHGVYPKAAEENRTQSRWVRNIFWRFGALGINLMMGYNKFGGHIFVRQNSC